MFCKPARYITIAPPTPQTLVKIRAGFDQAGSVNQPGVGRPIFSSSRFTGPNCGLRNHFQRSAVATAGTILGKKYRVLNIPRNLTFVFNSRATRMLRTCARGIPIIARYNVL